MIKERTMPDDPTESQDTLPRIDLRIPGPWTSPAALMDALKEEGEYEIVEGVLVHVASGRRFELNASEPDDQIADLFAHGGRMPDEQVKVLAAHAVKVHVSGP